MAGRQVYRNILQQASQSIHVDIVLQIKLTERMLVDEVHIDIKELIASRRGLTLTKTPSLKIIISSTKHNNTFGQTTTIAMEDTQKQVFLLLSDVMIKHSTKLSDVSNEELPPTWINGRGTILEASCPASTLLQHFRSLQAWSSSQE